MADGQPAEWRYPSFPGSKVPSLHPTASCWDSELQDIAPELLSSFFQTPQPDRWHVGGWEEQHCLGTPNLATELVASPLHASCISTLSESPIKCLAGSLRLLHVLFILHTTCSFYLPMTHPLIISIPATRKKSTAGCLVAAAPSCPKVGRGMCHLLPVALRAGLGQPSLSFPSRVMKVILCPPANALGCLGS